MRTQRRATIVNWLDLTHQHHQLFFVQWFHVQPQQPHRAALVFVAVQQKSWQLDFPAVPLPVESRDNSHTHLGYGSMAVKAAAAASPPAVLSFSSNTNANRCYGSQGSSSCVTACQT